LCTYFLDFFSREGMCSGIGDIFPVYSWSMNICARISGLVTRLADFCLYEILKRVQFLREL
jgi:hypothetical protein